MRRVLLAGLLLALAAMPVRAAGRARVASLLPWVTDALQRVPRRAIVVATATDTGFAAPKGVADLGSPHTPSFEVLAAARPDVIIGDRRLHGVLREKLARHGAKVLLVEGSSVEGTFAGLIEAGDATGAGAEMRAFVAKTRSDVARLRLLHPAAVLPLFGTPSSFMAVTGQTWLGDLLRELGFRNLVQEAVGNQPFPGYVELSDETLATLKPELVVIVAHAAPDAVKASMQRKGDRGGAWRSLAQRTSVLPADLFSRNPGLRLAEAARHLIALNAARPRT